MLHLLKRLPVAIAFLALTSCYQAGRPVAGVADAPPWFSLNFDEMLHEGDAAPEALSFCAVPQCPKPLVIGTLLVTGESADQLEAMLRHPERLAAELKRRAREPTLKRAAKPGTKQHIATATTVTPLQDGPAPGFTLTMARKEGKGRINATVLGWRDDEALHVVIAIGDDAEAVTESATRAAVSNKKSRQSGG